MIKILMIVQDLVGFFYDMVLAPNSGSLGCFLLLFFDTNNDEKAWKKKKAFSTISAEGVES